MKITSNGVLSVLTVALLVMVNVSVQARTVVHKADNSGRGRAASGSSVEPSETVKQVLQCLRPIINGAEVKRRNLYPPDWFDDIAMEYGQTNAENVYEYRSVTDALDILNDDVLAYIGR